MCYNQMARSESVAILAHLNSNAKSDHGISFINAPAKEKS